MGQGQRSDHTHADGRGADTDARRGHRPFRLRTYRLIRKISSALFSSDRHRTLLLLLLHPEDVPHHPRTRSAIKYRILQDCIRTAQRHVDEIRHRDNYVTFALLDRHDVDRRRLAALPRHQIRRAARRRLRPADGRHVAAARRTGPHASTSRIGVVRRTAGLLAGQGEDVGGGSGHLAIWPIIRFGAAQQPHRRIFRRAATTPYSTACRPTRASISAATGVCRYTPPATARWSWPSTATAAGNGYGYQVLVNHGFGYKTLRAT